MAQCGRLRQARGDLQGILEEGRQVYVEVRLRTREYEARNGGGKRQRTEIVALRVQFLGPPPAGKAEASAVDEPPMPADSDIPF
jgi:single-stranded DNA-binding protein